jgi:hypothetical protein
MSLSNFMLAAFVLLTGVTTYALLKVLIRPVRVAGACLIMLTLAALIVQNRQTIARQGSPSDTSRFQRQDDVPSPTGDPDPVSSQRFSQEDHIFLDEILNKQDPDAEQQSAPAVIRNIGAAGLVGSRDEPIPKALAVNTAEVKHTVPVAPEKKVKRAELVRIRQ